MRAKVALALLFVFLLATRLCHSGVVWVEEAYPAAGALQILAGKTLYRDIWFDKPPLTPLLYLLWGAHAGWPLRLAGAAAIFAMCWMAFRTASIRWSEREGVAAAWLLGFFLTFGIPAAVIAIAPDLLLILPHLAAVYFAWRGRPFWSGMACGVGLLVNPKALFVLAAMAIWQWRRLAPLAIGFVLPNAIAVAFLWGAGALPEYWRQVWVMGEVYSRSTPVAHPWREGVVRTLAWAGFHSALLVGAAVAYRRERDRVKWVAWIVLAAVGVVAGWRFFPVLFPAATAAGAGGLPRLDLGKLGSFCTFGADDGAAGPIRPSLCNAGHPFRPELERPGPQPGFRGGSGDDPKTKQAGRHAPGVGLSSGRIRLHSPACRNAVSRLPAADGSLC